MTKLTELEDRKRGRRQRTLTTGVLLVLGALAAAAMGGCRRTQVLESGPGNHPVLIDEGDHVEEVSMAAPSVERTAGEQMLIRLGPGQADDQPAPPSRSVSGDPLPDDVVEQILARLPALQDSVDDQREFRLPDESPPPPRTGDTIQEPFPPPPAPVTPPDVPAGPLEVLRFAPEGEISLAPFVNVAFSQPMVPVAPLQALEAEDVPVVLDPPLPGAWKWLGTKTLRFEYDSMAIDRLPMATEYEVTIPAGTQSATGGTLEETVSWTFRTPPASMTDYLPRTGPQPLNPLFMIAFDQRIDPEAVLPSIQVRAGGEAVAIRLASTDEVEADEAGRRLAKRSPEGRWIAFVAEEPLPQGSGSDSMVDQ
jgi:hypothetical protein